MTAADSSPTNCTVVLRGFEATLTESIPIQSYETRYVPGYHGRRHYYHGYYETVPVTTYVSRLYDTDVFRRLATDRMESAGFVLKVDPADYIVEADFTGPSDAWENAAAWRTVRLFCTIFTSDRDAVIYGAKLKIYDNRTGRLIFVRDYTQVYDVTMFSPIPVFGPLLYDRTGGDRMKCWCLSALTERVTADASAYLATVGK